MTISFLNAIVSKLLVSTECNWSHESKLQHVELEYERKTVCGLSESKSMVGSVVRCLFVDVHSFMIINYGIISHSCGSLSFLHPLGDRRYSELNIT